VQADLLHKKNQTAILPAANPTEALMAPGFEPVAG
jgi:hypothetical protein